MDHQLIDDKYSLPIARVTETENDGMFCCCPRCGKEMELEFMDVELSFGGKVKEVTISFVLSVMILLILVGSFMAIYDHFYY